MKNFARLAALILAFSLTAAFAGSDDGKTVMNDKNTAAATETEKSFPFEFESEFSYASGADLQRGFRNTRDLDADYEMGRFIYTPRIAIGILRLGAEYERFGFGYNQPAFELPNTLQSVSAVIGLDTKFSDSILVRFEAQPGLYGAGRLRWDAFHAPFVFGGTYIYSPTLQFVFGVSVDYDRSYPVFPGGGIRWRFGANWVLNAVMPTPRLEYELNRNVTIYGGADLKGSSFRTDERFGTSRGNPQLNNAMLSYSEIRTGGGVQWKLSNSMKLSVEGGIIPYQTYDFFRTVARYHQEGAGTYGMVAFNASF
ncbi:MAG TPA: DUF6268 family outer membrane beta-barrel protein [Chthoniobacterales bacterium]